MDPRIRELIEKRMASMRTHSQAALQSGHTAMSDGDHLYELDALCTRTIIVSLQEMETDAEIKECNMLMGNRPVPMDSRPAIDGNPWSPTDSLWRQGQSNQGRQRVTFPEQPHLPCDALLTHPLMRRVLEGACTQPIGPNFPCTKGNCTFILPTGERCERNHTKE